MMITPVRLLAIFGIVVVAFGVGLLAGRGSLGSAAHADKRASFAEEPQSAAVDEAELAELKPQIDDAVRRWSQKSRQNEQIVREAYQPRSMFIPTRNQGQGMLCIELRLRLANLGGSPVYCYQADFFKPDERATLVAEYSDVE
ncbi:hypothetical protein [Sphingomonas sp.]|uniref:hypothetical protein n=1 Tax=Sphingomonas sp. TaxID=28214 RepID=UPI003BA8DDA7